MCDSGESSHHLLMQAVQYQPKELLCVLLTALVVVWTQVHTWRRWERRGTVSGGYRIQMVRPSSHVLITSECAGHCGASLIELPAVQQKADKVIVEATGRSSGCLPSL